MDAHTLPLPERDRWLPWVGLAAFVIMTLTLITHVGLPPFPATMPPWAFAVILGCLLVMLASFTLFLNDVLTRDVAEGSHSLRAPAAEQGAPAQAQPAQG